jgi:hypothetical protein
MKPSKTVAAAVLLAMAPTVTGCHRYVPVEADGVRPETGQRVRAYLKEPDRVRLTHITAENVIQVNGELVEWDNGRVVISAFWLKASTGIEHRAVGETVALQESSLRAVEEKQISVALSAALAAAAVAGVLLIGAAFGSLSGGGEGGNDPGNPDVRVGGGH